MPSALPYTYYACPCTDISKAESFNRPDPTLEQAEDANHEGTLDPSNARANHVLFPLENLLFCNECHEIRCPRCYYEEALYYYCPDCLMETSPTTVRMETIRCSRSCLQCPLCVAPLQLQVFPSSSNASSSTATRPEGSNAPSSSREGGPFILSCPYCMWSTLEVGIKFEKNINIISQLSKIQNIHSTQSVDTLEGEAPTLEGGSKAPATFEGTKRTHFEALREFYRSSLAEPNPTGPMGSLSSSFGMDSPAHLSRLLTAYGVGGLKKQQQKPMPMREVTTPSEGLAVDSPAEETGVIERMRIHGWDSLASTEQSYSQTPLVFPCQIAEEAPRFIDHLRPTPTKLRSRRSKRCQNCRYHLLRPDDKRHSARYKLRLLALNFIPRLNAAPMNAETVQLDALKPGVAHQFIVTCRNPLYDPIRVKLGTPNTVPRQSGSRVTILCPQFDIGASTDVWDEALDPTKSVDGGGTSGARGVAEAGKVWKKGRNWTSVVLELVPGTVASPENAQGGADHKEQKRLEIPILVRMEYFTDASATSVTSGLESPENSPGYRSAKEERVPKETEFWVVIALGTVSR